jgi:hypothetical protein
VDGRGENYFHHRGTKEHRGRRENGNAVLCDLCVCVVRFVVVGLYLRSWLRERKALASEPQRDMIV